MTDDQIEHMASGLPLLEDLYLYTKADYSSPTLTQFTLVSIHHLVGLCQHLTRLELNFNATHIPRLLNVNPSPRAATYLTLYPRFSVLNNPGSVANWLISCLGRPRRINLVIPKARRRENEHASITKWRQVRHLIAEKAALAEHAAKKAAKITSVQ